MNNALASGPLTTVMVVDDHPVVRQAVVEKIRRLPAYRVIGEAGSESAFRDLLTRASPDVGILDLHLPREEGDAPTLLGPEIFDEIRSMDGPPRIVVFSGLERDVLEMIAPKVDAVISKSQSLSELSLAMSVRELIPATVLERGGTFLQTYQAGLPTCQRMSRRRQSPAQQSMQYFKFGVAARIRVAALLILMPFAGCSQGQERGLVEYHVDEVATLQGGAAGAFTSIRAIDYADGVLAILDMFAMEILLMDDSLREASRITLVAGEGPGEIVRPVDIALSRQTEEIYVMSQQARQVAIVDFSGTPITRFPIPFMPTGISSDLNGLLIGSFWLSPDSVLHRFSSRGEYGGALLPRPQEWRPVAMAGAFARFLGTGENGTALFAYPTPYEIIEISEAGQIVKSALGQTDHVNPLRTEESAGGRPVVSLISGTKGLAMLDSGLVIALAMSEDQYRLDFFNRELQFQSSAPLEFTGLSSWGNLTAGPTQSIFLSARQGDGTAVLVQLVVERE
jgi:CheY-like chemotaxis protein